jgi:adenosylmethionine-8-amino-7-oxononanoate aminotransferase
VHEALSRLDSHLAAARRDEISILKIVHGYGSHGAGGDIRIAVQKRLIELAEAGQIRACIFGEDWSKANDVAWRLLQSRPELKDDSDLGRGNKGITVVLMAD